MSLKEFGWMVKRCDDNNIDLVPDHYGDYHYGHYDYDDDDDEYDDNVIDKVWLEGHKNPQKDNDDNNIDLVPNH